MNRYEIPEWAGSQRAQLGRWSTNVKDIIANRGKVSNDMYQPPEADNKKVKIIHKTKNKNKRESYMDPLNRKSIVNIGQSMSKRKQLGHLKIDKNATCE